MKRIKAFRVVLFAIVFTSIATFSDAQGIVGNWKKKEETITKKDGKTKSTFSMMIKNMPCFANIVYSFSADGKMDEKAKDCAVPLQKQIAASLKNARWKMAGGKLIIDVSDATAPVKHAEYQIELKGKDEMIWTFNYAENPGVPNITKARQMRTTYVRQ